MDNLLEHAITWYHAIEIFRSRSPFINYDRRVGPPTRRTRGTKITITVPRARTKLGGEGGHEGYIRTRNVVVVMVDPLRLKAQSGAEKVAVPWVFASMARRHILPQRFEDCRSQEH